MWSIRSSPAMCPTTQTAFRPSGIKNINPMPIMIICSSTNKSQKEIGHINGVNLYNSISNLPPLNNNYKPTRRKLVNFSIIIASIAPFLPCNRGETETETGDDSVFELERYTDMKEGFTLLRPKSWIKVEKAGATLLFEDPSKGSNNLGVVVTPVRLNNLGEFGDPEFVSNKLIQAEKRKESTKDVEIVSFRERPSENGELQVYEFEYNLDSTRGGLKTIFSAAFVASKKLYLLNIAHSQQPPLLDSKRNMLKKVLHSFDVPSSTSL